MSPEGFLELFWRSTVGTGKGNSPRGAADLLMQFEQLTPERQAQVVQKIEERLNFQKQCNLVAGRTGSNAGPGSARSPWT